MEHTNHTTVHQVLKHNKKIRISVGILLIATVLSLAFVFKGNYIAATVDGRPISRQSVVKELEKQNGKAVLDTMISEKIIQNEASKKNIVISDTDVDEEIKSIEKGVMAQGGTLDMALAQQGLTLNDLKERIKTQKMVEKLLEDKIKVTEAEINTFINSNKIVLTKGKEYEIRQKVSDQLRDKKLNQEAQAWIANLKSNAKINYYVNY